MITESDLKIIHEIEDEIIKKINIDLYLDDLRKRTVKELNKRKIINREVLSFKNDEVKSILVKINPTEDYNEYIIKIKKY